MTEKPQRIRKTFAARKAELEARLLKAEDRVLAIKTRIANMVAAHKNKAKAMLEEVGDD